MQNTSTPRQEGRNPMQIRAARWQVLVPAILMVIGAQLTLAASAGAATFGPWSSAMNVESIPGTSADLTVAVLFADCLAPILASARKNG